MNTSSSTHIDFGDGCSDIANHTETGSDWSINNVDPHVQKHANFVSAILELSQYMRMQPAADRLSKTQQDLGYTDRGLSPSQRERLAVVQPTFNLYHWKAPADERENIIAWVKASCVRSNDIVRQRADTLRRNAAIRWSRNDVVSTTSASTTKGKVSGPAPPTSRARRSFSFEDKERHASLRTIVEKTEDQIESEPSSMTRVDSGISKGSGKRSTRFHEEPEKRPRVACTFPEILGSEPFIPTALLEK